MQTLGDPVMKPFLQDVIQLQPLLSTMTAQMVNDPGTVPQDVIQLQPLLSTMTAQMVNDPGTVPQLLLHVGPGVLVRELGHYCRQYCQHLVNRSDRWLRRSCPMPHCRPISGLDEARGRAGNAHGAACHMWTSGQDTGILVAPTRSQAKICATTHGPREAPARTCAANGCDTT